MLFEGFASFEQAKDIWGTYPYLPDHGKRVAFKLLNCGRLVHFAVMKDL